MSKEWREMWMKAWPNEIGHIESQDKVKELDVAEEKLHKNIKKEQNIAKKTRKLKLRVLPNAPHNSPASKSK